MQRTVLVIEDDKILQLRIRKELDAAGYRVFNAYDGKQGVHQAVKIRPDIVLSDILMPSLNGYQVYKTLREHPVTQGIPVIFMSGKSAPNRPVTGMDSEADDYLAKPFTKEDLLGAVSSRLAQKTLLEQTNSKNLKSASKNIPNLEQFCNYFDRYGVQIKISRKEEIYRENSLSPAVYLIKSGLVKTCISDQYGKELITGLHGKKDFLGFHGFDTPSHYPETALALQKSVLIRIPMDEFRTMVLNSRELTLAFAQLLSESLCLSKSRLLEMAYGSVLRKTVGTLLTFAEKLPEGSLIGISRRDLASMAGISTESFIRSLSSLRRDGLIAILGRKIKILDLEKLRTVK